jgi:subtilisin
MKSTSLIVLMSLVFLLILSSINTFAENNDTESRYIVITNSTINQELLLERLEMGKVHTIESFVFSGKYITTINTNYENINNLRDLEYIEAIHEDLTLTKVSTVTSLSQTIPWGIKDIEAERLDLVQCNCKIAVIDSGIGNHSELSYAIKAKVTYLSGIEMIGQAVDDTPDSHGTHVSGIIASKNDSTGITGIVNDSKLYIAKVLDKTGVGFLSDIVKAIEWSINNQVDIINLSLGTTESSPILDMALNEAYKRGIIIVAASGNDGGQVMYPANSPYTIGVGAMDKQRFLTTWTSFGQEVDILAPGVNIYSTINNNLYKNLSGTSMAAPHVTGSIAKLLPIYNGKENHEKVEWMRKRITQYSNIAYQSTGDRLSSVGSLNIYRSYFAIPYLTQASIRLADNQDSPLALDELSQFIDQYGRVMIYTPSGEQEYQIK